MFTIRMPYCVVPVSYRPVTIIDLSIHDRKNGAYLKSCALIVPHLVLTLHHLTLIHLDDVKCLKEIFVSQEKSFLQRLK